MPVSPKNKKPRWIVTRDDKGVKPSGTDKLSAQKMSQWYSNKRWRSVRASFIKQNPLCVTCEGMGVLKGAEIVDHIIPIRQGGNEYDVRNLQSMCKVCHDKKSRKERDTMVYNRYNTTP